MPCQHACLLPLLCRFQEEIDCAAELGCNNLQLSLEWARIEPRQGVIDHTAVARYHEILDCVEARGMQPMLVLWHFVHPGAWAVEDYVGKLCSRAVPQVDVCAGGGDGGQCLLSTWCRACVAQHPRGGLQVYDQSSSWYACMVQELVALVHCRPVDAPCILPLLHCVRRCMTYPVPPAVPPAAGWFEDLGGWESDQSVKLFAGWAETAHQLFGQRVSLWGTLNEPTCASTLGWICGMHPPGKIGKMHMAGEAQEPCRGRLAGAVATLLPGVLVAHAPADAAADCVLRSDPLVCLAAQGACCCTCCRRTLQRT